MLKRKIIVAAVLLLLAGGFVVYQAFRERPTLVIENRSGQRVVYLQVQVGDQRIAFRDIKDKVDIPVTMQLKQGETLTVNVRLEDRAETITRRTLTGDEKLRGVIRPGGSLEIRPAAR